MITTQTFVYIFLYLLLCIWMFSCGNWERIARIMHKVVMHLVVVIFAWRVVCRTASLATQVMMASSHRLIDCD